MAGRGSVSRGVDWVTRALIPPACGGSGGRGPSWLEVRAFPWGADRDVGGPHARRLARPSLTLKPAVYTAMAALGHVSNLNFDVYKLGPAILIPAMCVMLDGDKTFIWDHWIEEAAFWRIFFFFFFLGGGGVCFAWWGLVRTNLKKNNKKI